MSYINARGAEGEEAREEGETGVEGTIDMFARISVRARSMHLFPSLIYTVEFDYDNNLSV